MKKMLLAVCVLFIMLLSPAYAFPAIPDEFFGTVTMDGKNVSAGSIITVTVNSEADSQYNMTQDGYYGLFVKKGSFGDTITFSIDGKVFGTRTRAGGSEENYNLSYTTPPQDDPPEEKKSSNTGGGGGFVPVEVAETLTFDLDIEIPERILVTQGGTAITTIKVKNTGNGTIEDILLSYVGEFPSAWIEIEPKAIKSLGPDEERQVMLTFSAPENTAKSYSFMIKAEPLNKTASSTLEVTKANLMNANNIKILSIIPEKALTPGNTTKFFVTLENTGTKTEYGLLQLNNFGDWNLSPAYRYIGVGPGLQATVIFEVTVPNDAKSEKKQITAALIGQSVQEKKIDVEVSETVTTTPTGFAAVNTTAATGLAAVLILAIAFYFFKLKKN